jgi:hypothetical protein
MCLCRIYERSDAGIQTDVQHVISRTLQNYKKSVVPFGDRSEQGGTPSQGRIILSAITMSRPAVSSNQLSI